jgi:hypothetical protein
MVIGRWRGWKNASKRAFGGSVMPVGATGREAVGGKGMEPVTDKQDGPGCAPGER